MTSILMTRGRKGPPVPIGLNDILMNHTLTLMYFHFSKFDLYTKSVKIPDIEALKPYYQGLIDKYIPGIVKF